MQLVTYNERNRLRIKPPHAQSRSSGRRPMSDLEAGPSSSERSLGIECMKMSLRNFRESMAARMGRRRNGKRICRGGLRPQALCRVTTGDDCNSPEWRAIMLDRTFYTRLRDSEIYDDIREYCRVEGVGEDHLRSSLTQGMWQAIRLAWARLKGFTRFIEQIIKGGESGRQCQDLACGWQNDTSTGLAGADDATAAFGRTQFK